jgi:hypothetical protein
MLFSAVSSRCFSAASCARASAFCRLICRTIRNRMTAITDADSVAATIRNLVCACQSARADSTLLVATTTIGKRSSITPAPSRSR